MHLTENLGKIKLNIKVTGKTHNMDFFKSFFDFSKLPTKFFIVISVTSGIFLFSNDEIIKKLRLNKFEHFAEYIGLVFLFSTILVIVNFIIWCFKKVDYKIKYNKLKKEYQENVKKLDHKEKAVLREFFLRGQNSISMPIDDEIVARLLHKNILILNSSLNGNMISTIGMEFPVSMSNYIDKIITNEDVNFIPNPTEEEKQKIINSRPNWTNERWR